MVHAEISGAVRPKDQGLLVRCVQRRFVMFRMQQVRWRTNFPLDAILLIIEEEVTVGEVGEEVR
eukprot:8282803-Ditylum_brightwellii.AAC.1